MSDPMRPTARGVVGSHVLSPGPSPRVRGSRSPIVQESAVPRSNPRVCGGAIQHEQEDGVITGPSPRVRGSPFRKVQSRMTPGSIPACAGEPRGGTGRAIPPRVHPRVCGGALVPVDAP